MSDGIPDLPPKRTLAGDFDAYCHVCWYPVYALWIDANDDPAGKCFWGHTRAQDCEEAKSRAKMDARVAKWRADGVLI